MLSKTERDYLSGKFTPNKNYEYKILYSIRKKLKEFYHLELPLINSSPKVPCAVGAELGKLTSYQTKLTPPRRNWLTMIKYLNLKTNTWMQDVLNVKKLQS
jgi:hypothetical protein